MSAMKEEEERVPPPDIYANSTRTTISPYDVYMRFIRETPPSKEGEAPSEEAAVAVRMSHAHAWVLVHTLKRTLEEYVRNVGPISLPIELIESHHLEEDYAAMQAMARKAQ